MIRLKSLLLLLLLSLLSLSSSAAPGGGYASPVTVATAQLRMMAPQVWVSGEVISRANSAIPMEMSGRLLWVAEMGTRADAGELLARIDTTLLQQQLEEQQAIVVREEARLEFLEQEVQRLNSLVNQRNVSQSALEQTISDRAVARGDLVVAKLRVEQVMERLKRSEIRAPYSGVVSEQLLQVGEWADSGKPILRLVDIDNKEISTWVTAQMLPFIHQGDHLAIDSAGKKWQAEVSSIVPVASRLSRLYELRLSIAKSDGRVGETVRVAVPTAQPQQQLSVPRDALVLRRDGRFVFRVVEGNKAERVAVTTGIAMGEFIQVSGALELGDQVIVNGGERLRPGQSVKVINPAGATQ